MHRTALRAPIATTLDATVEQDKVVLALHVRNTADEALELRFPDGQLYDFAVLDDAGHELWRWSTERLFTQTIQTKQLDDADSMTVEAAWAPRGRRGRFTAVATLRSTNFPAVQRVQFSTPRP
jgi:hypothetical protein